MVATMHARRWQSSLDVAARGGAANSCDFSCDGGVAHRRWLALTC